jgi:hypothetical protein
VPLWHWVSAAEKTDAAYLQLHTMYGSSLQRTGAISAVTLVEYAIVDAIDSFDRHEIVSSWFKKNTEDSLKKAGLAYLRKFGNRSDIGLISELLESSDYQMRNLAAESYIKIILRENRDEALDQLVKLQPESISESTLTDLFQNPNALKTDQLVKCVTHRNEKVRLTAARLLRKRGCLNSEIANQLVGDSNAWIRFEAMSELAENEKLYSDEEVRKILVKPRRPSGLSLLGNPLAGNSPSDPEGEEAWEAFRQERLSKLSKDELKATAETASIYDWLPLLTLYRRYSTDYTEDLRQALTDHFAAKFDEKLVIMEQQFGPGAKVIEDTRDLKCPFKNERG